MEAANQTHVRGACRWNLTYTGKQFDPLAPVAGTVDIRDIAHALSMYCRFGGHCSSFWSVASHSIAVSMALQAMGAEPVLILAGLLHDASEAYLPDLASPIKGWAAFRADDGHWLSWKTYENQVMGAIVADLGLEAVLCPVLQHPWIKAADNAVLLGEYRALMPQDGYDWQQSFPGVQPFPIWPMVDMPISLVKQTFLDLYVQCRAKFDLEPDRNLPAS